MESLGRIEQKIDSHLQDDDRVHARTDKVLTHLVEQQQATSNRLARYRGVGIGAAGVFSILLAVIKLDYWR
jgi:hypothetical protein